MLIPNQIVEVKMSGRTINHYRKLGYKVNNVGETISVPVEHLTSGSHVIVKIQCDICGEIFEREYKDYLYYRAYGMDFCKKCSVEKSKLTCFERYGVDNVAKTFETKEKMKRTCVEKYGVENYSSTKECRDRVKQTCIKKYGVENFLSSPEVREQIRNTVKEKYGVDNVGELDFIHQKARNTMMDRYGVEYAFQSPIIQEKIRNTLLVNNNVPTSKQQLEIYNMLLLRGYDVKLNEPVGSFSLDISLYDCDKKIDIEYDGWYWHQDLQKDRRRDEVLKSKGWKILRIKSNRNIPNIKDLLDAIEQLVVTDRTYKEIKLDDWKDGESA
jgi:very-short-patch-repair endonuclease